MTLVRWESLSFSLLSIAAGTVVRSLVLGALCALAAWLLRSRTAALRHLVWKGLLWALLAMPVLLVVVPPLVRTSGALTLVEVAVLPKAPVAHVNTRGTPQPGTLAQASTYESVRLRWLLLAAAVCVAVGILLLIRLLWSLWRLESIAAGSEVIADEEFRRLAHELWLRSESSCQPRIAVSREIPVPVTFGVSQAQILLPRSWVDWDEATLRAVLMHELAHGKRQDSATALLASLATCLFLVSSSLLVSATASLGAR